LKGKGSLW